MKLDDWLDSYYRDRPQLTPPPKDIFGVYQMPTAVRFAFEKLHSDVVCSGGTVVKSTTNTRPSYVPIFGSAPMDRAVATVTLLAGVIALFNQRFDSALFALVCAFIVLANKAVSRRDGSS